MIFQQLLDKKIFTVNYIANRNDAITLLCPGVAWSKAGPYFLLSKIALALYSKHNNAILFDYYGQGDSFGGHEEVCFESMYRSLDIILKHLSSRGYTKINLLGIGIGNYFAHLVANRPEVAMVVFIDYDRELFSNLQRSIQSFKGKVLNGLFIIDEIDTTMKGRILRALVGITPWYRGYPINVNILNVSGSTDNDILVDKPVYDITKAMLHGWGDCLDSLYWKDWVGCAKWPGALEKIVEEVSGWIISHQQVVRPNLRLAQQMDCDMNVKVFEVDNIQAIFHISEAGASDACIVYEPGIGGDRVDHMRCGVELSRAAQQSGFSVLRYDFRGTGISAGDFYKYTWTERIQVFYILKEYIMNTYNVRRFYIVSFSEGAKMASWLSQNDKDVKGAGPIIRSEIVNYHEEMKERHVLPKFMKYSKSREMVLPVQGYYLGLSYFQDHKKYDFYSCMEKRKIPMKIFWGEQDPFFEKNYFYNLENKDFHLEVIENEGHLFGYQNMQLVIEGTVRYLRRIKEVGMV